jgi:hypothetical protein
MKLSRVALFALTTALPAAFSLVPTPQAAAGPLPSKTPSPAARVDGTLTAFSLPRTTLPMGACAKGASASCAPPPLVFPMIQVMYRDRSGKPAGKAVVTFRVAAVPAIARDGALPLVCMPARAHATTDQFGMASFAGLTATGGPGECDIVASSPAAKQAVRFKRLVVTGFPRTKLRS